MRINSLHLILVFNLIYFGVSCSSPTEKQAEQEVSADSVNYYVDSSLQDILDEHQLRGSILVFDVAENSYYSNDFEWSKQGRLPASTFKIPNSVIALDLGIVEDDSTLFPWNGEKRRMKIWEQDLLFSQAFHLSCVPCYQEIARKIGFKRMREYLKRLNYGEMQVDSSSEDVFWLEGDSKISQFQQISFLSGLHHQQYDLKKRSYNIIKRMMILDSNENYVLRGKTGWSIRNGNNNGWFVGYVIKADKSYFFATNVTPTAEYPMANFIQDRKEVSILALKQLNIL